MGYRSSLQTGTYLLDNLQKRHIDQELSVFSVENLEQRGACKRSSIPLPAKNDAKVCKKTALRFCLVV